MAQPLRVAVSVVTILTLFLVPHAAAVRVYSTLQSPAEHPLAQRRAVTPPEYSDFGPSGVGFMGLRSLTQSVNGTLDMDSVRSVLDQYTVTHDVISVIWPNSRVFAAPNFPELTTELTKRNLGLMFGGFVPGGRQQYNTSMYVPHTNHLGAAKAMGPKYLGMGQSEQDIRFLWGYAKNSVTLDGDSNFEAFRVFNNYANTLEQLSGNQLFVLARGVFTHHYLQTGLYTVAGAELSGRPPAQVTYAFIRGASKQYGTLIFSDVCTFTGWGHKVPGDPAPTPCTPGSSSHGPTCGTSYSSVKRLTYNTLLSDVALVGFEDDLFYPSLTPGSVNTTLSPMGKMLAGAKQWVAHMPQAQRGVHLSTTGLLIDYFAGWETPCSDPAWPFSTRYGQVDYVAPDFLTDGVLELAYPGYRSAGYYKDAAYELSPTPYGDVFDVLLSDVSANLLNRYDTIIVAHELTTRFRVVADNLESFVLNGGHLVMTWDSLADLDGTSIADVSAQHSSSSSISSSSSSSSSSGGGSTGGSGGSSSGGGSGSGSFSGSGGGSSSSSGGSGSGRCTPVAAGVVVTLRDSSKLTESRPQTLCAVTVPSTATVVATTANGNTVAFRTAPNSKNGTLTLILFGNYGVTSQPATALPPTTCQANSLTQTPRPLALL